MKKSGFLIVGLVGTAAIFAAVSQAAALAPEPTTRATPSVTIESKPTNTSSRAKPAVATEQPMVEVAASPSSALTVVEPLPPMTVVAEAADGYIVFVEDADTEITGASDWPQAKLAALVEFYEAAAATFVGENGFGTAERWAEALGISRGNPLRVVFAGNQPDPAPARAGWREGTAIITHYNLRTSVRTNGIRLVLHELAHIWDGAHGWALGEAITTTVENPDGFPTAKARDEGPKEDFAESVTATLWPGYAVNQAWSDDEPGGNRQSAGAPDSVWTLDRHDYVESLFGTEAVGNQRSAWSAE